MHEYKELDEVLGFKNKSVVQQLKKIFDSPPIFEKTRMNRLNLDELEKPSQYLQETWKNAKQTHPFKFIEKWAEFPEFHNLKCAYFMSYRDMYFGQVD